MCVLGTRYTKYSGLQNIVLHINIAILDYFIPKYLNYQWPYRMLYHHRFCRHVLIPLRRTLWSIEVSYRFHL